MDDIIFHYFPILRNLFVKSESKSRRRQRWILTKEYLLPFETYEDYGSLELVEGSGSEFYLKLQCAYNAAKLGVKEGVLTGVFFGGLWGIIKEINQFSYGFFENVKTGDEDVDLKSSNRSYTVIRSFEYSKYEATKPISTLSNNRLLDETLKNYHHPFARGKLSDEKIFEAEPVKSLFKRGDTNPLFDPLNTEFVDFYQRYPFGVKKGKEKVEIVGCALIQTGGSMKSTSSESSTDSSEEFPIKKKPGAVKFEEIIPLPKEEEVPRSKPVKTIKNITASQKKINIKKKRASVKFDDDLKGLLMKSLENRRKTTQIGFKTLPKAEENYKTTLLDNVPFESYGQEEDNVVFNEKNIPREAYKRRKSVFYRKPRITPLLPHEFLNDDPKPPKTRKVQLPKKKIPFLVDLDDLGDGYTSEKLKEQSSPPKTYHLNTVSAKYSDTKLFLEEINDLKERLLNESHTESSSDVSSLDSLSYTESRDNLSELYKSDNMLDRVDETRASVYQLEEHKVVGEEDNSEATPKETPKIEPEVTPTKARKSTILKPHKSSKIEVAPMPKRRTIIFSNQDSVLAEPVSESTTGEPAVEVAPQAIPHTSRSSIAPSPRKSKLSTGAALEDSPHLTRTILASDAKSEPEAAPRKSKLFFGFRSEAPQPAPKKASVIQIKEPQVAPSLKKVSIIQTKEPEIASIPKKASVIQEKEPEVALTPKKASFIQTKEPQVAPTPKKASIIQTKEPQVAPTPKKASIIQEKEPEIASTPKKASIIQEKEPQVPSTPKKASIIQEKEPEIASTPKKASIIQTKEPQVTPTPKKASITQTKEPEIASTPKKASIIQIKAPQVPSTPKKASIIQTKDPQVASTPRQSKPSLVASITSTYKTEPEITQEHRQTKPSIIIPTSTPVYISETEITPGCEETKPSAENPPTVPSNTSESEEKPRRTAVPKSQVLGVICCGLSALRASVTVCTV